MDMLELGVTKASKDRSEEAVRYERLMIARMYYCGSGGARAPEMPYRLFFPTYSLYAHIQLLN